MAVLEKDEPLGRRRHQATGLFADALTHLRFTLFANRFRE
jgi:hypothetical protein